MEKITTKTIEQENPHFVLEIIAETVAEEAVAFSMKERLDKWGDLDKTGRTKLDTEFRNEVNGLTKYLCERADTVYQYNKDFNKKVKAKGNGGRDYLYVMMYHWSGGHHNGAVMEFQKGAYKKSATNWYREMKSFNDKK